MNKKYFLAVFAIIALVLSSAFVTDDENEANKIYWTAGKKLTWADFISSPDEKSSFYAYIYTGLTYKLRVRHDSAYVTIVSYMRPDESWYKTGKESASLLMHEQVHFDIAELCARNFRKAVGMLGNNSYRISVKLHDVSEKYYKMRDKWQDVYDDETNHGLIDDKQREWEKKVEKELAELSAYADSMVILPPRNRWSDEKHPQAH